MIKIPVSKGYKLNEIDKNKVERSGYSNENNLIFRYKENDEWFFVYDEKGNKISKEEAKKRTTVPKAILKEFLGNDEVLRFLVAQPPKETGGNNDR